jgi:hypothetical protein
LRLGQPAGNDFFSQYMDVSVVVNPRKAIQVLGWQPFHLGLLDELPVLYEAVKAFRQPAAEQQ